MWISVKLSHFLSGFWVLLLFKTLLKTINMMWICVWFKTIIHKAVFLSPQYPLLNPQT
jgi:hypothetical protein